MKRYIILLFLSFSICSCNKFLDVAPKGYTLLNTVNDYDQWLIGNGTLYGTASIAAINYLADNVDYPSFQVGSQGAIQLIYTWMPQFVLDNTSLPPIWASHYSNIYTFNAVINGVMDASGGDEKQKKELYAEALLGRALEYLYLVNLYGKVYDPATADTDPGVPWVTSVDISAKVPGRSSVKQVYDNIIADLNRAIPDLPSSNSINRYRGSQAGAYSVLARAYLYARNYEQAEKNAQLALLSDPTSLLINYNTTSPIPDATISSEALYARGYGIGLSPGPPSTYSFMTTDFISLFSRSDLRLTKFFGVSDPLSGGYSISPITNSTDLTVRNTVVVAPTSIDQTFAPLNSGTSIPEMKLIIAEAEARKGNLTAALDQLNELRKNRIRSSDYQSLDSTDPNLVLSWVFDERQREMAFVGIRWFDMRRYTVEGRMPTVNRYDETKKIIATLAPNSNAYVLQIPLNVLRYNPDMPQNPL